MLIKVIVKSKFTIEAILNCDERGQLVLPKEIRKKLNIKPGEKLALLQCVNEKNEVCLTLLKANALEGIIKTYLSPMLSDIIK